MSSRKPEADGRLPLPAPLRGPWSITGRLALLYLGSTGILLGLAAIYLYTGLEQSLARADHALLHGKLQVLRLLLSEEHDKPEVLASEIEHEASSNALLKYYLRVLDDRGRVLLETSGMSGFLPVTLFPRPAALRASDRESTARASSSNRNYLLMSGEAVTGAGRDQPRVLQIALDVGHNAGLLAESRRNLLAMFAVGIVFAGLAGIATARHGLRPLQAIARATRRITASKLDERLIPADWPSELRECAGAFDAMLDRLQESFNRLGEFSADIAHAMRNPINNLRGEAEVALTQSRTPEDYRQVLASSLEEYERLSRLTEGLLFIARADDPRTALERVRFPVHREAEAVREFYDAVAGEQHVTVTCAGEAWLTGEPMLVRRAISNLLANALKHTAAGGTITLTTEAQPDGTVEIRVSDTGSGIAPEHLPRVFDRFYQVDKTRATAANGAGLGLAIVQSIMRLHGGTASVQRRVDRGTTFTLRFPADAPAPSGR